jgi:hypothetical protein
LFKLWFNLWLRYNGFAKPIVPEDAKLITVQVCTRHVKIWLLPSSAEDKAVTQMPKTRLGNSVKSTQIFLEVARFLSNQHWAFQTRHIITF